jgi:hypothetical protein
VTRALPFTQIGLRRAIEAARKAGLRVTGIRPDGTLIVRDSEGPIAEAPLIDQAETPSKWQDVEA